jgi:methylthioxylose transferase
MAGKHEYVADVGRVGDLGTFLSTFLDSVPVDSADPWVTHVSGHPPGALLVFVLLDRAGLGGPGWAAVLCIVGGAVAVPAVLVAVRALADEGSARAVAPFAVLFPAAVWIATSADALFAGVLAWGIALLALGAARGPTAGGLALAGGGGVLLGVSLYLSNGLTAAGLLALTVVLLRRRELRLRGVVVVLAAGAVGVLVIVAVFTAGGYWWFEGFAANAQRVRDGAAYEDRPYRYFVVANVAAAAIAAGPAVVAGLAGVRGRLGWVALAALGGMAVSDVSGLVLGETERIWLPFLFWLLPATASLPARTHRWWLGAAALLAIAVEVVVGSPW